MKTKFYFDESGIISRYRTFGNKYVKKKTKLNGEFYSENSIQLFGGRYCYSYYEEDGIKYKIVPFIMYLPNNKPAKTIYGDFILTLIIMLIITAIINLLFTAK